MFVFVVVASMHLHGFNWCINSYSRSFSAQLNNNYDIGDYKYKKIDVEPFICCFIRQKRAVKKVCR